MGTPTGYQRSSQFREYASLAAKQRADALFFKFEEVATTDNYTAVSLTQIAVGDDGTTSTIDSDDARYELDSTAKIVNRPGLGGVALDFKSATNNADVKIQVRNPDGDWIDLEEAADNAATSAVVIDTTDGHTQLRVLVKSTGAGNAGSASGYLALTSSPSGFARIDGGESTGTLPIDPVAAGTDSSTDSGTTGASYAWTVLSRTAAAYVLASGLVQNTDGTNSLHYRLRGSIKDSPDTNDIEDASGAAEWFDIVAETSLAAGSDVHLPSDGAGFEVHAKHIALGVKDNAGNATYALEVTAS